VKRKQRKYPMRPIGAPGYMRPIGRFLIMSADYETVPYRSLVLSLHSTGPFEIDPMLRLMGHAVICTSDPVTQTIRLEAP
jgi:hypothetical protein